MFVWPFLPDIQVEKKKECYHKKNKIKSNIRSNAIQV